MAEKHTHFPTLDKLVQGTRAAWIARTLLNERAFLRLALYGMLVLSVTHVVASRAFAHQHGMSPLQGGIGPRGFNALVADDPGGFLPVVLTVTFTIVGPWCAELAPLMIILCLAGLAATPRARRAQGSDEHPSVDHAKITAVPPEPERSRLSPPPPRHPLDPDPTDSPLSPRRPKT
jgi:hypothetical protein